MCKGEAMSTLLEQYEHALAEFGSRVELVKDDQWSAAYFKQGLGTGIGQRTHPLAAACGENHGFHLMYNKFVSRVEPDGG